ncbi:MAG: hypothetical protein ACE15E_21410 [Acidobacteriota bacterium]
MLMKALPVRLSEEEIVRKASRAGLFLRARPVAEIRRRLAPFWLVEIELSLNGKRRTALMSVDGLLGTARPATGPVEFQNVAADGPLACRLSADEAERRAVQELQRIVLSRSLMAVRDFALQALPPLIRYYHPIAIIQRTRSDRAEVLDLITGYWQRGKYREVILEADKEA